MNDLCAIAIEAIADKLAQREPEPRELPWNLAQPGASFVTLEHGDDLLGCVGTLEPTRPLGDDVARHAIAAAFADPRVPPITVGDFEKMSVKVSVLSTLHPLAVTSRPDLVAALRPGIDGLVVDAGRHRATFLPSVWAKVRSVDAFVDQLWHKARLAHHAWPVGLSVFTYTTVEYADPGPRSFA